ncbi:unnamed protein product [Diamesa hyperborea]
MIKKTGVEPSEIGRHPTLIQKAQKEMSQSDVLVCGKCHNVFHYVDLFNEHKSSNCNKASPLKDVRDTKPKVWAFLLWKTAQMQEEDSSNQNAWKLYQTWVMLEDSIRDTWLVAGRTIQSFAKFGSGTLQEMPVKITKTVSPEKRVLTPQPQQVKRIIPMTNRPTAVVSDNRVVRKADDVIRSQEKVVLQQKPGNRFIPRTDAATETIEKSIIEKIIAKRLNPRQKQNEYLVKWESKPQTWEPASHLESCKDLIENFETLLTRQKEMRSRNNQPQAPPPAAVITSPTAPIAVSTPNRPQRYSKAKAIDNVKQWTSANKQHGEDSDLNTSKRKMEDSDEYEEDGDDVDDEDFEMDKEYSDKKTKKPEPNIKRMRTENTSAVQEALMKAGQSGNVRIMQVNKTTGVQSEISKNLNGSTTVGATVVRKVIGKSSPDVIITRDQKQQSGVFKKSAPGNVLIKRPNEGQVRIVDKNDSIASGIVRISPQSNVTRTPLSRVVPKSSPLQQQQTRTVVRTVNTPQGQKQLVQRIIQKSPATGNKATPPNVRVVPRPSPVPIRNTPIRGSPQSPANSIVRRTTPQPVPTAVRRVVHHQATSGVKTIKKIGGPQIISQGRSTSNEEDDDGIPDPFPEELPALDAPGSPQSELTLCPITGKVLGKDGEVHEEQTEVEGENQGEQQQIHQLLTNEDGSPIFITGEDGTIYQVAGKNAKGETILISTGADGEQTCVLLSADQDLLAGLPGIQTEDTVQSGEEAPLTVDAAVAEAVASAGNVEQAESDQQFFVKDEESSEAQVSGGEDVTQQLSIAVGGGAGTDSGDSQDGQITAEIIQADEPSPGGTRKVVLMLPDGNLMVTELSSDQFQSLNIQQ